MRAGEKIDRLCWKYGLVKARLARAVGLHPTSFQYYVSDFQGQYIPLEKPWREPLRKEFLKGGVTSTEVADLFGPDVAHEEVANLRMLLDMGPKHRKREEAQAASTMRREFAERLKGVRLTAGYATGRDFAKALNIDENRYTKYERVDKGGEPPLWLLRKIAETANCSLDFLISGLMPDQDRRNTVVLKVLTEAGSSTENISLFWASDINHRFMKSSEQSVKNDGYGLDLIGKTRWELAGCHDPDRNSFWMAHKKVMDSHKPFNGFFYRYRDSENNLITVSVNGRPFIKNGVFLGYIGISEVRMIPKSEQA